MTSTAADPTTTTRGQILAWGLWDWGSAAFNAVATTFVFTVYLTGKSFGEEAAVSAQLGWALGIAGIVVLLIAPVTGQRSDTSGRRKLWLAVNTAVVVACLALMFLVQPSPDYLLLGLILLAVGTVFFEIAGVNYNAMLAQISTPKTVGRVSGFGWGMGYIGGIVLLLIVYFGFIKPEVGLFGVTGDDGLAVRVSMVIAALWFADLRPARAVRGSGAPGDGCREARSASASCSRTPSSARTSRGSGRPVARPCTSCWRAPSSVTGSPASSPSAACSRPAPSASPPAT